jgi:hypothetical protein
MGSKSRETLYGSSVRAAAGRATEARKTADRLAVEAWNKRMLGFQGPGAAIARARRRAQCRVPLSRSEMPWLQPHQTGALDIVRRPKATPVHELGIHAVQGLLCSSWLSVQAQSSGRAQAHEDFDRTTRRPREWPGEVREVTLIINKLRVWLIIVAVAFHLRKGV